MDVLNLMKSRRSIRKYDGRSVEEEKLTRVLEAGRLAPSARNMQEWKFVVVRGSRLASLAQACNGQQMVQEAGTAIVVCATENHMMGCGQPRCRRTGRPWLFRPSVIRRNLLPRAPARPLKSSQCI